MASFTSEGELLMLIVCNATDQPWLKPIKPLASCCSITLTILNLLGLAAAGLSDLLPLLMGGGDDDDAGSGDDFGDAARANSALRALRPLRAFRVVPLVSAILLGVLYCKVAPIAKASASVAALPKV